MRGFSMAEADMENIAKQPWVATSTDGGIALPGGRAVHARALLRQLHAQDPALRAGARRHLARARHPRGDVAAGADHGPRRSGQIREGMAADLVVFDLATIKDKATFFEPHQHSEGIEHVFVNGVARVSNGTIVDALPGRVLARRVQARAIAASSAARHDDGVVRARWRSLA
jgi:N-acyl-D-amino-acid deacylase